MKGEKGVWEGIVGEWMGFVVRFARFRGEVERSRDDNGDMNTLKAIDSKEHIGKQKTGYLKKVVRFTNIEEEIRKFSQQYYYDPSKMPTLQDLKQCGRKDLIYAIQNQGGFRYFAKRLDLKIGKMNCTNWTFGKLRKEILVFREDYYPVLEFYRVMPNEVQFRRYGRNDISYAIRKFGGHKKVRERLGLGRQMSFMEHNDPRIRPSILAIDERPTTTTRDDFIWKVVRGKPHHAQVAAFSRPRRAAAGLKH